jgi:signal transduction histidine kinase
VILNLLLNAKDAMLGTANPMLKITTCETGSRVLVRIQDSGAGIERDHLHRIYDPFFTTKTKPQEGGHKGTGLGLAVSYGIIQEHAGKIHVESEPGKGTTFQLEFPIAGIRAAVSPETRTGAVADEREEVGRNTIHV